MRYAPSLLLIKLGAPLAVLLCAQLLVSEALAQPQAEPQAQAEPTPQAEPAPQAPPKVELPPPEVEMLCQPVPVRAGLPTTCTLTITHLPSVTVKVNAPQDAEQGAALLPRPSDEGAKLTSERAFTIRHLALNKPLRVKGVSVTWDSASGQSGVVEVPPQRLEVMPSVSGVLEPKPRTFRAPLAKPTDDPQAQAEAEASYWAQHGPPPLVELNWLLIIALALIAVSVVSVGVGWAVRRWFEARRLARLPKEDTRPAHVIALELLERLERERLPELGEVKVYYGALSEVLRGYLARRYALPTQELTSGELRRAAESLELSGEVERCLEQLIETSDLVLFAKLLPHQSECEEAMRLTRRVIELTPPEPNQEPDQEPQEEPHNTEREADHPKEEERV